jgi:trigger factor
LAQEAGYDDLAAMRDAMSERAVAAKRFDRSRAIEHRARQALAENLDGDVPEVMVSQRTSAMIRDFFNSLESRGITPEQYTREQGLTLSDLEGQFEEGAREGVAVELALEALFRELGMEVTDEDIEAELRDLADGDADLAQLRERFEKSGVITALKDQIAQQKATAWLLDHVEVVEEEPAEPETPEDDASEDEE